MHNAETFPRLVEAHYAALYRFALSLTKRPVDALDLTQQTFFYWAKHGHSLRDPAKAKSWLFTTLRREFLHTQRRARRLSSIEDLPSADRDPTYDGTEVSARMDAELVMGALQDVDLVFREALTLFYLRHLSCIEIAEILSIPIGTVSTRLFRGKRQLRALLEQATDKTAPPSAVACA